MQRTKLLQPRPIEYCLVPSVSGTHRNTSAVSELLDLSMALKGVGSSDKQHGENFANVVFRTGIFACSDTSQTTDRTEHTSVSLISCYKPD